jgi:predicted GNAT family N-acyltransferase
MKAKRESLSPIGRIAVPAAWRRHGIGSGLVRKLIASARQRGLDEVYLNAQVRALRFYERPGFLRVGEICTELPHVRMIAVTTALPRKDRADAGT